MKNEHNERYSWNPEKRKLVIETRGLDFVVLADLIFEDPNVVIFDDVKPNEDDEPRRLAYANVDGMRLCLCFTERNDKIHLITIFRMHEKQWSKRYEST